MQIEGCWEDMLQACQVDDRVTRPKRKFIDQKLKPMKKLLNTLAKYALSPPGSTQKADAGMKYRQPRWHQTLRAIFDDYETETQAKMISLIDSSFVDKDQSNYVSTSDNGFNTSSSNNGEE
jgi:hypothetical protein